MWGLVLKLGGRPVVQQDWEGIVVDFLGVEGSFSEHGLLLEAREVSICTLPTESVYCWNVVLRCRPRRL